MPQIVKAYCWKVSSFQQQLELFMNQHGVKVFSGIVTKHKIALSPLCPTLLFQLLDIPTLLNQSINSEPWQLNLALTRSRLRFILNIPSTPISSNIVNSSTNVKSTLLN